MSVKGFSLIEVVVVMVLIALTLTVAGPRIGAGLGRLELERSAQTIRSIIKIGRVQASRADKEYYVKIDRKQDSIALLDPEMKIVRQEELPPSVEIFFESGTDIAGLTISPFGIVRGSKVRLHSRAGDLSVDLQ
jgi:prepilin-type N-terminal cleavage/methylation domain-containing protein